MTRQHACQGISNNNAPEPCAREELSGLPARHDLIHYKHRCEKQCEMPSGEQLFIHDSCSECHIKPDLIRKRYERLHEETQNEYRLARREGRLERPAST